MVQEWAEWELALLEARYCLDGLAFIQSKTHRSRDSIRRKASNLDLSSEMRTYTPIADVAKQAGVTPQSVWQWLAQHDYRQHCRMWGRCLLMPLPAVNLYLDRLIIRRNTRPAGWWGTARAAEYLSLNAHVLRCHAARGDVTAARVRKTLYFDPHSVREYRETRLAHQPRPNEVQMNALATVSGFNSWRDAKHLPTSMRVQPGTRPARYTTHDAARSFLTARGHREEMVETLLRKALLIQESKVKGNA